MTGYDHNSIALTLAIIALMLLIVATWWNLERGNDRAAIGCAVVTIAVFFLFALAQNKAERKAELEHAVEQNAVQEQLSAVQKF